jgi:hypothetical protein
MMGTQYAQFASALAEALLQAEERFSPYPGASHKILIKGEDGEVSLDLTPFEAVPQPPTAAPYFQHVVTIRDLFNAYQEARRSLPFEMDNPQLREHVHSYANAFLDLLFQRALAALGDAEAQRIAAWVRHFDVYVAVKSVESLLNSRADLALLGLAQEKGWDVHFDHLAIRCGSALREDTEQVVELLCTHHGYTPSQVGSERAYYFPDGWRAYPLYKILENGQVLRLFLDESDGTDPGQIIQHWNRVYGFTAHHLAIRATHRTIAGRVAVPLETIAAALARQGVSIMTPTGGYTYGMLVQVFTRPEWDPQVPQELKQELRGIAPGLGAAIENGKLLEILSRREVSEEFARDYYTLYGLRYDPNNPLHSVPAYQYFLPAQAAHVIRTSVEARQESG